MLLTGVLALLCCLAVPGHAVPPMRWSDEQWLLTNLLVPNRLRNAHQVARPVRDHKTPVTVEVGLALGALKVVNADMGNVAVGAIIYIRWQDEFLQWRPEDYNGLDLTQLPPGDDSHIWHPDVIRVGTTLKEKRNGKIPRVLTSSGMVTKIVPVQMDMQCLKSPDGDSLETHILTCIFTFGSEHVPPSVQDTVPWEGFDQINTDKLLLSDGTEIVGNTAERVVVNVDPFDSTFAYVHFKLSLRVRSGGKPSPLKAANAA